ncbi:hypothetical protein BC938DRAFT_476881, partial [Jimgerdemannia flammicorona]
MWGFRRLFPPATHTRIKLLLRHSSVGHGSVLRGPPTAAVAVHWARYDLGDSLGEESFVIAALVVLCATVVSADFQFIEPKKDSHYKRGSYVPI